MLRGQLDAFLHPCDSYASRIAAAVTVCELEVRAARLLGDPLPALTPEWLKLEGVGRLQREAVTDQYCAAAALAWYKYHTNMHPDAYEHIQIIPDTAGVFLACPEYPLRLQRA
jgi:hypothetical protein